MALADFAIIDGESDEMLCGRIVDWVRDNLPTIKKIANRYLPFSPLDREDVEGLAILSGVEAARAMSKSAKSNDFGFGNFFAQTFGPTCYNSGYVKVTPEDLSVFATPTHTPEELLDMAECDEITNEILRHCWLICRPHLTECEAEVLTLYLSGDVAPWVRLGCTRQNVQARRDRALRKISALMAPMRDHVYDRDTNTPNREDMLNALRLVIDARELAEQSILYP